MRDIETKNIDLLYAWDAIDRVVQRQLDSLDYEHKRQRIGNKPHYQFKVFDIIRGLVSFTALDLAYEQMELAKKDKTLENYTCTGRYSKSMGIPCKCVLRTRLATGEVLRITDFNPSWYLRTFGDEVQRPILPPRASQGQRYRRSNGSRHSTKRLLSGFERQAKEIAQKIAFEQGKPCW